mmetsp:Transcript_9950/g.11283  ORF Transcript_9950/g.11283 Transcript_9950/m.11283 type:complete len:165 (+) Transcript_9950:238-732(+)
MCINTSLTFKKPSNKTTNKPNSFDDETQCDSQNTESDNDSNCEEQPGSGMSEEDYCCFMDKIFYIVKDAKERRKNGFYSPLILRHKMYDILSRKSTPLDTHLLFEEGDLNDSSVVLTRKSVPCKEKCGSTPRPFIRRSRMRTLNTDDEDDSPFSSFFKFLTKQH